MEKVYTNQDFIEKFLSERDDKLSVKARWNPQCSVGFAKKNKYCQPKGIQFIKTFK